MDIDTLRATIVETSAFESTCDEKSGGNIDSQGSNVADDGTCFTGGLNGDQVVESALLGPLTNNGGPTQPNETFTVTLSSPTNGAIGRSLGRGTIVDNDGPYQALLTHAGAHQVGMVAVDGFAVFAKTVGLVAPQLSHLLAASYLKREPLQGPEYFALRWCSAPAMMMMT